MSQKLFSHMSAEHGLTLTQSEMEEIKRIVLDEAQFAFRMESMERILQKAKITREAQKEYFRTRDSLVLKLSKRLEQELDKLLASAMPDEVQKQQSLF